MLDNPVLTNTLISLTDVPEEVENNRTTNNELSFEGFDEEEVHHEMALSENVQTEENVAKLEATLNDVLKSTGKFFYSQTITEHE